MPINAILLVLSVVAACPLDAACRPDSRPLADAIASFNAEAAIDPVGQRQLPLTEAELIAVLRWAAQEEHGHSAISRISDPAPSRETYEKLRDIVETQALPEGARLERLTGYEPDDRTVYEVWSVRLRMTREDGSSFVVSVREQMVSSRVMGQAERAVVQQYRRRFAAGVGSMERGRLMQEYKAARDEALRADRRTGGL